MEQASNQLLRFWDLMMEVWQDGVAGVDFGRIFIAVGIVFAFFVLRNLITRIVISRIHALTRRTTTTIDDVVIQAVDPPLRLMPIILGLFIALEYLSVTGLLDEVGRRIIKSLLVFALFWGFYRLTDPITHGVRNLEAVLSPAMVDWLAKIIKGAVIVIGLAAMMETWGIAVGPIIAGLGLFGVAVALGAQDLFKNLISGILIIAEKRFDRGDWIHVDGIVEGTVELIGFRSTIVRRFDKAPVYVPNVKLADSAVTNFSAMTHRRIYWIIGVEYRTTVDQLRQIRDGIEAYVTGHADFAQKEEVSTFVRIDSFNNSSIDIMLYCFTRTTNWGEWLEIKEALALKVKDIVEEAGTAFAFPSRSLYVETMPGPAAEVYQPPETATAAAALTAKD